MHETFVIADLPLSVTVSGDLQAWEWLRPRYSPFASVEAGEPTLDVDVKSGPLPVPGGELIYAPAPNGLDFFMARVWRGADGRLEMEFWDVDDPQTMCLWMRISPDARRAEIVLACDGDDRAPYLLTHALMMAFMIGALRYGVLVAHSAAVMRGGKAYLFQGKSGTGKSTHARMWLEGIPGTELLNDDNPLIRISDDGVPLAYGSPWSGKTDCYRNVSAPIGAFVRIARADHNELRLLPPLLAYASLSTSLPILPFLSDEMNGIRGSIIERLAAAVPCCRMLCEPTPTAAVACLNGLTSLKSIQI